MVVPVCVFVEVVEMLFAVVGEPGVEGSGVLRMNPGVVLPGVMCGGGGGCWGVLRPKRFVGACCVLRVVEVCGLVGVVVMG